jgi:hypothetical protein
LIPERRSPNFSGDKVLSGKAHNEEDDDAPKPERRPTAIFRPSQFDSKLIIARPVNFRGAKATHPDKWRLRSTNEHGPSELGHETTSSLQVVLKGKQTS